ncbi:MAG TPA: 30S ribosomal protein S1 [Pyrinomonadaceae bacterium]|nr:30S ribosomal protein S1 [Pyrinomonadaceae bacterium]
MSTEQPKPTGGDANNETTQTDAPAANAPEQQRDANASPNISSASAAASTAPAAETSDGGGATAETAQPADAPQPPTPPPPPPTQSQQQQSSDSSSDDDDSRGGMSSSGDFDFGAILDQYEQEQAAFQEGSVVRGTVVDINERGVVIDFGFKSEGVVNPEEFMERGELTVKRGDEVEVLIKSMETQEGVPILSRADAVRMRAWDDLEKAYRDGTPVKGRIADRVKGGLRVDVDGVAAFLPGSQVDVRPVRNLDSLRGQEIEALVIKLNRKRSNVVLSRKAVIENQNAGKKGETLDNLEEGIIVEGQIKNLTDYGAFVDLGGIDGLLHVTDMSWGRLQNPAEMFKVGESVQVKVLKFDKERERVSLGYKHLLPDPWESVSERYPQAMRLQGKIASVTDYGAFIELEPGVEGLVHVSEMSWSKRMKHPSKLVNVGDTVDVEVLGVDPKARHISLGMKQIQPNPWQTLRDRYEIGSRVKGRVRNLTDFGAFIEVEDGVDGLVHVSDISWNKRIKHPGEVLKKGQEIEAVITNIDVENRRLSLSIKDTEPSSWERFVNEHKPGDIIRGKITRFANFGAFVELDEGLEGLCHVSELSDERVERPEDVAKVGQEMDFRILRIEQESKKIGLSARAARHDEPVVETKQYSSEARGGMASLGELADIFGKRGGTSAPTSSAPSSSNPEADAQSAAGAESAGVEPSGVVTSGYESDGADAGGESFAGAEASGGESAAGAEASGEQVEERGDG